MNAIKFFKVDFARNRVQFIYLLAFAILAFVLSLNMNSPYFGLLYVVFAGIIFSTVPFTQDQTAEIGFINMLPGTVTSRVIGRYLVAIFMIIFGTVLGSGIMVAYTFINEEKIEYALEFMIGAAGAGIFVCSLQYIIFYLIGKIRSVQGMSIVRMIPGFVMFFGSNLILGWMEESSGESINWILSHTTLIAFSILAAGVMLCLLGIFLSRKIVERRDLS